MKAVHPVIRTNPVTGWKSVFAIGAYVRIASLQSQIMSYTDTLLQQPSSINGLTPPENEMILDWLMNIVLRNHDLQCRFRWQGPNDMGTWPSIPIPLARRK